MELGTIFWTALVVGFSGAIMPGPLLTVTIGESVRRGFIAGPLLMVGHALLEILLVLLLVWGAAELLMSDRVHTAIALVGGCFLIYMGQAMYRDARAGKVTLQLATAEKRVAGDEKLPGDRPASGRFRLHPVPAGILVSLSNPYWSLWWATVGLAYITTSMTRGTGGLVAFMSGHLLSDFIWYGLVAGAVAGGRRFLSQRFYRGVIVVCGVFLVGLGGYFVYQGLS
ncbi:LysE family transporter [Desulfallas thermosapovorans]|uniref:Threonine/homoserine/homoserine lactone efflux protein n=1 Tax=Desulfallas thermosapovorans DSM 6562 TaxID=1121431 RepID=A0A5S4ZNE6_9FIRM|nr:LysE family transporter [Desulfallas thermosapovorans]TYO93801.1 threonine/homoserine/homoserine lactone efflux protein [Desulfallas thermosapovorans DSM 6562]